MRDVSQRLCGIDASSITMIQMHEPSAKLVIHSCSCSREMRAGACINLLLRVIKCDQVPHGVLRSRSVRKRIHTYVLFVQLPIQGVPIFTKYPYIHVFMRVFVCCVRLSIVCGSVLLGSAALKGEEFLVEGHAQGTPKFIIVCVFPFMAELQNTPCNKQYFVRGFHF